MKMSSPYGDFHDEQEGTAPGRPGPSRWTCFLVIHGNSGGEMLFVNGSHVRAHARGVSVLYDQQARSVEGRRSRISGLPRICTHGEEPSPYGATSIRGVDDSEFLGGHAQAAADEYLCPARLKGGRQIPCAWRCIRP